MAHFSETSKKRLKECESKLQVLFEVVIKYFDCKVLTGHRGMHEQNEAYEAGNSTKQYPDSKHNSFPSKAIDVAPYPIDWEDKARFYYFAGVVMGVAAMLEIPIRWGGDWDQDTDLHDQLLFDLVHFELVSKPQGG